MKKRFFKTFEAKGGQWLHIESDYLDECLQYMYENNIKCISITGGSGYCTNKDISFLYNLREYLEGLMIDAHGYRYGVINKLHCLRVLSIEDNKQDIVEFNNFPDLEHCSNYVFCKRFVNIECCKRLKSLRAHNYKSKNNDFSDLPGISSIEELMLFNMNVISLKGIERFPHLKNILLYHAHKLESIEDITFLSNTLEELEIKGKTKVRNYTALGKLHAIRKIILDNVGEIESLAFLPKIPNLELFSFPDSNVVDGDLSNCKTVKGWVGFTDKKHYSHKFEDFHPGYREEERKRMKELDENGPGPVLI